MEWTTQTKREFGSITNFILAHRLPKLWGEPPFTPISTVPFENPADYRILHNDWPYGVDKNITHIVVWSRTLIETEPTRGDMTPASRQTIQEFVDRTFVAPLGEKGKDKVLWFKNWVALQSVRALEHIHVLVRDADPEILKQWTEEKPCHRGETPQQQ